MNNAAIAALLAALVFAVLASVCAFPFFNCAKKEKFNAGSAQGPVSVEILHRSGEKLESKLFSPGFSEKTDLPPGMLAFRAAPGPAKAAPGSDKATPGPAKAAPGPAKAAPGPAKAPPGPAGPDPVPKYGIIFYDAEDRPVGNVLQSTNGIIPHTNYGNSKAKRFAVILLSQQPPFPSNNTKCQFGTYFFEKTPSSGKPPATGCLPGPGEKMQLNDREVASMTFSSPRNISFTCPGNARLDLNALRGLNPSHVQIA
jgi:hypothetical protein